jgi:hypothetical protein
VPVGSPRGRRRTKTLSIAARRPTESAPLRTADAPSTLLGVAALGYPDQLVEIEALAALP